MAPRFIQSGVEGDSEVIHPVCAGFARDRHNATHQPSSVTSTRVVEHSLAHDGVGSYFDEDRDGCHIAHLLTHWIGQNARLLCSSIAWSRATKLSCSRNARRVSRPATVSVKWAKTGEKAIASSLHGSAGGGTSRCCLVEACQLIKC